MVQSMLLICSQRFINHKQRRLEIYRYNMYAAGATAKITAVFFFVFIMRGSFCNSIFHLIIAGINTGAGHSWQQQQVNTKYDEYSFHNTKIMDYEKTKLLLLILLSQQGCNNHKLSYLIQFFIHQFYHSQV